MDVLWTYCRVYTCVQPFVCCVLSAQSRESAGVLGIRLTEQVCAIPVYVCMYIYTYCMYIYCILVLCVYILYVYIFAHREREYRRAGGCIVSHEGRAHTNLTGP